MKTSTPLPDSLNDLKVLSLKKTSHCFKIIIAVFLLTLGSVMKSNAQDNSGKEFWFTLFAETYLDHLPGVYIVSYYDCTVTIDYAARNPALDPAGDPECTRHTVNVTGGVPLYVDIPYDLQALCWRYADDLTVPETVQQNGIRVTSTAPIALYSQFLASASSEMTPILPIEEMGTEYIATAYREITDPANDFNARASVTAIENGTVVTFTLPSNAWTSTTNLNGGFSHGPGSTWSVTLNRGETYTVLSNDNGQALTNTPAGSTVTVNNNQGLNGLKITSNKIISVMGGTDCTWVGNDEYPGCGACDLTSTHLKPVSEWKTRYISTQTLQRPNQMSLAVGLAAPAPPNIEPYPAGFNNMSVADYLLITAKDNGTTVNITGQATYTKTLNAGQWFIYESPGNSNPTTPPPTTSPGMSNHVIQSNNPIQVVQMMKGWQCDNNNPADPTQMLVIEESMWRDNYIVTNPTQYANNFFVFIVKEPSGTNVARNSLNLVVNGAAVPIPAGNSPTNDGTLGWSRMGTVEPYFYQRVNIAAGGAIKVKSVPLTPGGTTYPFAFYASGSTNASSYGYMGGAVCNLKAFAHADTANICLGTPTTLKLDSTQNGGSIAGITLYTYTWTVMNGATTVFTVSGTAANPNQTFTAPAAGVYTGYLNLVDNAGCTARDTFNIYVNATLPAPTVGSNISVCQGQNINLTANSTVAAVTYAWTGPSSFTSSLQNPVITNASSSHSGTYSVTVTKNGCTSLPATISVTVNPNAVITLTSAAGTNTQTLCANTAITPITYSITGGGTGATVTGLPAGLNGTYAGGAFTINGTPSVTSGTFNYTVTTTGNCTQASASGSITINPNATISLSSSAGTNAQSVCIGTAIAPITYSVGGGGTGATVTGLPSGVSGSFTGSTFTINGTPTVAGTFNYTVTTTGTCTQTNATGSITVNPNANISLTSAAGTNAQTKCINTAITTITYSISGGGTGAGVTGLPAGVTGSFAGGTFTISGTPTAAGTFPYTVTTTGTCTQTSASGTLTINPNATITLTSAAGTNAQTICINNAITSITYSVGGGGTGATVTGLPAGVSGSFSGSTFTISGTPTVAGTFNYTVTTTGSCTQTNATGSITVNPNASISLTSAAGTNMQSVCINAPIVTITYSITNGGTGATFAGLPAGVTGSFAGGTVTISGTPTVAGTFNYTVTTTGPCTPQMASGSITVNDLPVITSTPVTNETSCGANDGTITINATGTGLTYSINGGTSYSATNTFTGLNAGPYNIMVQNSAGCTVSGNTVSVTSAGAPPTPTANANPNPLCAGGTLTLSVTSPAAGETYNWSGPGYTATGATVTIPNVTNSMSGIYTVTASVGSCVSAGSSVTVTINPDAAITLTSAASSTAQAVCINNAITNITYSITGGGTGATAIGLPAGVSGSFAGGIFTISGSPTATGTFNYTVNTTGTCAQASATGTITVSPDAAITLTSAAGTDAQAVCTGNAIAPITYSVSGGATGATVTGLPAGVSGSFAGGTFTISGTPTATGTFNYAVNTTGTCAQTSASGTITINPDAAITLTSAASSNAQSVCINNAIANITYSITGGGTSATATGLPAGVTGSFAGGIFTISGSPAATGTFNYTVNTTGTCAQASATGSITVNPDAAITLTSAAGTDAQTVCTGNAIAPITYSVSGGGTGATVTGLPAGVSGSFAGGTFTISGTPTATGTFNYTVNSSGTCSQTSVNGTITVNPDAAITSTSAASSNAQVVCINNAITNITYSITGGGTGATATGLPAGVTGSFAGGIFTISGSATSTGTFNYTVNTTGTCAQASATGSITVNPDAAITLTSAAGTDAQTVCTGNAIAPITYSVTGGGSGSTVTGLPAGVSGSFAGGTFTISGTPTATGTFNYTVSTTGTCAQASATGSITIGSNASITLASAPGTNSQSICINTALTTITYSISGATGATVTGLPSGVTDAYSGGILTISGTPSVSGSFNYTISATGGCTQTASGSITVNPLPVISSVPFTNETSCGANDGTITINATGSGLSYSIDGGSTYSASNTFTTLPAGSYNIFVMNSSGCIANGGAISISSAGAPAAPSASASPNPICEGGTLTLSVASPVAGEIYNWSGPGSYTGATVTITNVTPSMAGTYNVTATAGSCVSSAGTVNVVVNSNASITLTSGSATQTVCANSPIGTLVYSISGGGTGATVTGLPAGVTGSFAGGTFTISGTPAVTGIFNFTVNTTGICNQASASGTITVNPDASITMTSAAGTNTQSICLNTSLNPITYSISGGGTGAGVTGLPAGVTGAFSGGTFTISGTPTVTGTFNYTVNTTGSCVQTSAAGTITVNPNAAIALTSAAGSNAQSVCSNTPVSTIIYTISGGGTGATVSGLPVGISGVYSGGTFTISGSSSSTGTFSYTVNTTGTCAQTSATGTITITPDATVQLTSAPGTTAQTVCVNSAITPITYTVSGGGTGATVTGLPSGVSSSFSGGTLTISGTPTVNGTFSYTLNTTGTCAQASANGTITITPGGSSSFNYSSSTFCKNLPDPSPVITGSSGGTFSSSPIGLTLNSVSGVINLAASTANTYTVTYSISGACASSSSTLVTVTNGPTASASATSQVCSGANIDLSSTGGSTYSWTGPDNFTSVSQNPSISTASVNNSGTYTVTVNNGGCTDTAQVTISVTPSPSANAGTDQTITLGDNISLAGSGGTAFSWSPSTGLSCTNCADPVASPSQTTTYCLVTTNGTCSDTDCMTIEVKTPCVTNKDLGLPNAFSPNNDGVNDEFCIQGWGECMEVFNIIIFDRWGEKVFESMEADFCWNGTFRGKILDPAVFVYMINATFTNGESTSKKGNISIIR